MPKTATRARRVSSKQKPTWCRIFVRGWREKEVRSVCQVERVGKKKRHILTWPEDFVSRKRNQALERNQM